jgi:hypothetical protein
VASFEEIKAAWANSPIKNRIALLASEDLDARFAEITAALLLAEET